MGCVVIFFRYHSRDQLSFRRISSRLNQRVQAGDPCDVLMGKYKDILEVKRENSRKKEEKQEQLRQENGIRDTGYYLKEKTWKSYLKDAARHAWYLVYVALAFIGAVMLLHPESRHLVLQIFHLA